MKKYRLYKMSFIDFKEKIEILVIAEDMDTAFRIARNQDKRISTGQLIKYL